MDIFSNVIHWETVIQKKDGHLAEHENVVHWEAWRVSREKTHHD